MDIQEPRNSNQTSPSLKLSNGYILPEGKLTPNALFVGGIDTKVDQNEMRDFFAKYGTVKEVRIITYRGGICKGYGFVYFSEDVNIQSIIDKQISFKGRKLKLGPAIMKDRSFRSVPSRMVGPAPWMSPTQYFYCSCCSPMTGGMAQPSPILGGGNPYSQPYSYSNFGGVMIPQMPVNYAQNAYAYQVNQCDEPRLNQEVSLGLSVALNLTTDPSPTPRTQYTSPHWMTDHRTRPVNQSFVDCGVQTMLTVL